MSKDSKNTDKSFKTIFKTMSIIFVIALLTYAIMAVITHFSLHFELENYSFSESILSIFDIETAIFKFFTYFMLLNISWLTIAVLINYIKKSLFKNKYE